MNNSKASTLSSDFLEPLWDRNYVLYMTLAGLTLLIYDVVLTFTEERQFIWTKRWSFPKALYIVNRYGMCLLALYFLSVLAPWMRIDEARNASVIVVCSIIAIITAGNTLVLNRLIFLWQCSSTVAALMTIGSATMHLTIVGFAISSAVTLKRTVSSFNITLPQLGINVHTCVTNVKPPEFAGVYAPSLILDIYAFALLFSNALSRPRHENEKLLTILYGEGIVFFLICIVMHSFNLVVSIVVSPNLMLLSVIFGAAMVCNAVARFFLCLCEFHQESENHDDVGATTELSWQVGCESVCSGDSTHEVIDIRSENFERR